MVAKTIPGADTASTGQDDHLPFDDPPVADAGAEPARSTPHNYAVHHLDEIEKWADWRDELEQKRRPA